MGKAVKAVAMAVAVALGVIIPVHAAGNLPEWRYYASDGCADGAEATMANANALVDLPALRSVSTGFFAEPTSTQGSDTDGSQLRLCGQKGFLFNGAFGDLCNSPNFSPGGICLKIPATADLFGGGQSATGGYWAKLTCVAECPPPPPPPTAAPVTPAPVTMAPTSTAPTADTADVIQSTLPPTSSNDMSTAGSGYAEESDREIDSVELATGWVCDTKTTCTSHFGDAVSDSTADCCGSELNWRLECFACLADKVKPKRGSRHMESGFRVRRDSKSGKQMQEEPTVDRVDDAIGSGDVIVDEVSSLSPRKDDRSSMVEGEVTFTLETVCTGYASCSDWHGRDSQCCFAESFCRQCNSTGTPSTESFGGELPPQCWNEEDLAFFLEVGSDEITAARDFTTSCSSMLDGVYDVAVCCTDYTACGGCLGDPFARQRKKGKKDGKYFNHGKKITTASTVDSAFRVPLVLSGVLIVGAIGVAVQFRHNGRARKVVKNMMERMHSGNAIDTESEVQGLLTRKGSAWGVTEDRMVYGATTTSEPVSTAK